MNKKRIFTFLLVFVAFWTFAEDGYDLWLRYAPVENEVLAQNYRDQVKNIVIEAESPTIKAAKKELESGLAKMLGIYPGFSEQVNDDSNLVIGLPDRFEAIKSNV